MTSRHRKHGRGGRMRRLVAVLALAGTASAALGSPLRVASVSFQEIVAVTTNGHPEPGETGRLRVGLSADAGPAQAGPFGRLTVLGPVGVSVVSDMTTWPDLGARECAVDEGELVISVDAAVPCDETIELLFDLWSEPAGAAPVVATLEIGTGRTTPADLSDVAPGPSALGASIAWNGAEYGLAWGLGDGSRSHFVRLDGNGVPLAPAQALSGEGYSTAPAVAHGDGRWAVARLQDGRLTLWLRDAAGETSETDLGAMPEGSVAGPDIAWDGAGWSIVTFVERTGGRDRELIRFVRAAPDGDLLEGPTLIEPGFVLAYGPDLLWNGDELALLLPTHEGSRLAFLSTTGELLHVGPPVGPGTVRARLAWNGRTHAIGIVGGAAPHVAVLDRCGEALTDMVPLDVPDVPEDRDDLVFLDGAVALAAEGAMFALAASYRREAAPAPTATRDQWVTLYRFDEGARAVSPARRLTPAGEEGWALSGGMAWNADDGSHAVPAVHGPNWEDVVSRIGALSLARVAVEPRCTNVELPGEVSAPGSAVLLLARKQIRTEDFRDHADVVLSVEDLGATASSYNAYVFARAGRAASWVSCHHRVGGEPPATRVPPDRVELTVEWPYTIAESLFTGQVYGFRVAASNTAGEGPLGVDSLGRPAPVMPGCLETP